MKKIVLNLSDSVYSKFMFEAIEQKKDIKTIMSERLMTKPFSSDVEQAYEKWMNKEFGKLLNE